MRAPRIDALLVATILSVASAVRGQTAIPDWSGAWIYPFEDFGQENVRFRSTGDPIAPRLAPAYAALLAEGRRGLTGRPGAPDDVAAASSAGPRRRLNSEDCLPSGMPNLMRYSFAFESLFTPGR